MATRVFAKAIYRYRAQDERDIGFVEGDIIEVLKQKGDWWRGRLKNGREGLFPFNRVEVLPDGSGFSAATDNLATLSVRRSDEVVSGVFVELRDAGKGKKEGQCTYNVKAVTAGGEKYGDKTMQDFRRLDKAIRLLEPGYQFTIILPPQWSDKIPMTETQGRFRAELLSKYLANNSASRELMDILLLTWLKSTKQEIRAWPANDNVKVGLTDNRDVVMTKINSALSFAYKKDDDDGTKWFDGPSKSGYLSRVMFTRRPDEGTELPLIEGEFILVITKKTRYDGWWLGQNIDGEKGLLPSNYMQELSISDIAKLVNHKSKNGGGDGQRRRKNGGKSDIPMISSPKQTMPTMQYGVLPPPNNNVTMPPTSTERPRKIEENFVLKHIDAYDELREDGFTLERNGKYFDGSVKVQGTPKSGDMVTLSYSAYTWDPQSNQLREFASSDKLQAPPRGVASGQAGANGFKMEFVLGRKTTIDGLETVMQFLAPQQSLRAILAPQMAYGDLGSPPEIPPECFLVYDLTLDKIQKGGTYAPPRAGVFSVGISKPNVQTRAPSKRGAAFLPQVQPQPVVETPTLGEMGRGNGRRGKRKKKKNGGNDSSDGVAPPPPPPPGGNNFWNQNL